jgi:hypothetical protein
MRRALVPTAAVIVLTAVAVSIAGCSGSPAAVAPPTAHAPTGDRSPGVAAGQSRGARTEGVRVPFGPMRLVPPPRWTATVNGHSRGVPESQDLYTGMPQFDVVVGEKVTIMVTVTVPEDTVMSRFWLGITGDSSGIGPRGPIAMKLVLATAGDLKPGPHKFTLHWTVPKGTAPRLGYQLQMAVFWSKTANEPEAEEVPMVDLAVSNGGSAPVAAAAGSQLAQG